MIVDEELQDKVRTLCQRFGVTYAYQYVAEKNPSNNLPYHNWYHIMCMVEKVVEGANLHNLPYRSIRHLIIAALFHDFGHSGGKQTDTSNINGAIAGFSLFDSHLHSDKDAIDAREIKQLIYVTEYPYVLEPLCIEQKIIRDADLMQAFRPTWKEMIIDGLREEMSIRLGKELTQDDMCLGQVKFLKNIEAHSDWGNEIMFEQGGIEEALIEVETFMRGMVTAKYDKSN